MALAQILTLHLHAIQHLLPSLPGSLPHPPLPIQRRQQSSITLSIHLYPKIIQHLTPRQHSSPSAPHQAQEPLHEYGLTPSPLHHPQPASPPAPESLRGLPRIILHPFLQSLPYLIGSRHRPLIPGKISLLLCLLPLSEHLPIHHPSTTFAASLAAPGTVRAHFPRPNPSAQPSSSP